MNTLKSVSRETLPVDLSLSSWNISELNAEVQGSQAPTELTVSLQQIKPSGAPKGENMAFCSHILTLQAYLLNMI